MGILNSVNFNGENCQIYDARIENTLWGGEIDCGYTKYKFGHSLKIQPEGVPSDMLNKMLHFEVNEYNSSSDAWSKDHYYIPTYNYPYPVTAPMSIPFQASGNSSFSININYWGLANLTIQNTQHGSYPYYCNGVTLTGNGFWYSLTNLNENMGGVIAIDSFVSPRTFDVIHPPILPTIGWVFP